MKKLILCSLAIVSILAICFRKNILKACTEMTDPGIFRVIFFSPDLQSDKSNYPFFYSYQSVYQRDEPSNPVDTNIGEWENYFQHQAPKKDIQKVVYNLKVSVLESIQQNKTVPDSLSNNKCLVLLNQAKYKEALAYLIFAKNCEPFVTFPADPWDPLPRDTAKMPALITLGESDYKKTKDAYLKLRYAYQIVRLAGYSGDNALCIKLYDEDVVHSKVKSTIQNWALLIKAVALINTGKTDEGDYLLSHVFDNCAEKKIVVFQYFHESRIAENNIESLLALCKNNHEKAVIMAMQATGNNYFSPQALMSVYQYEPNSPLLENLLIREIGKIEDVIMTRKIYASAANEGEVYEQDSTTIDPKNLTKDTQTSLNQLQIIVQNFIDENKIKNKALLYLSKSYLSLLEGNTGDCNKALDTAKSFCEGNVKMEEERHFLLILNRINSYKILTPKIENEMVPDLLWLSKCKPINTSIQPEPSLYANIMRILAYKYEVQKDLPKAIVCFNKSGVIYLNLGEPYDLISRCTNHHTLADLHELLFKKNKNEYETLITDSFQFNKNRMLDFEGTLYLKEYNFAAAAEKYAQITNDYWKKDPFKTYLAANSFAVQIIDTHAKTKADTVIYNKYTFCEKMLNLLKKKDANSLYEAANGYYNMTYYGNSWLLVEDEWSGADLELFNDTTFDATMPEYDKNPQNKIFIKDYFHCTTAKEYYLKAMNASKDNEFKAQCCFMAAKCEQAEKNTYDSTNVQKSEQFELLKKDFSNTIYYKNRLQECALLKDFVAYKNMH
ncbi:MAG: hypothetical protein ABI199_04035 [Bacteroidia bacterium]